MSTLHGPADPDVERVAGYAALVAAGGTLVYGVAFVIVKSAGVAAVALLGGGLVAIVVLLGLASRIARDAPGLAALGLILGVVGSVGATIHGGFDLANVLHAPVDTIFFPNTVDPRGLLTFGVSGLGILVLAYAALRSGALPRGLSALGLVLGFLLVIVYLARLIVLDATNPIVLGSAALTGFIAAPLWNAWLGLVLLGRAGRPTP